MAEEKVLLRVGIDPDLIENSIKSIQESRKELDKLIATNKELAETEGKTSKAYIQNEVSIKKLNGTIAENQRILTANEKLIKSNNDSLVAMREKTKLLNDQYIKLSKTQRESDFGKKLQKDLRDTTNELKKLEGELGQFQRNVGNYKGSFDGFAASVQAGGLPMQDLTTKLTAFLNPLTAATAALGGLGALYLSSAAGARDLESATNKLAATTTILGNSFAELLGADGKGKGILSTLSDALIFQLGGLSTTVSANIVNNAKNALKELELAELDSKRFAKEQLDLAEQQRRIRDDETKSFPQRLEAARNVQGFIIDREAELVSIQQKRLDQLNTLLKFDKHNVDLQKEIKQIEFELADIREDSQGKQTEAINGVNNLLRDQLKIQNELKAKLAQATSPVEESDIDVSGVKDEFANAKPLAGNPSGFSEENLDKAVEESYNKTKAILDAQSEAEFEADIERRKMLEDWAQFVEDINIRIRDANLATSQAFVGSVAEAGEALGASAGFTKLFRSGETLISTYSSAQKAYESQLIPGDPTSPIRAGFAAAAAVISGLSRVALINKVNIGGASKNTGTRILEDGGSIDIGGNRHSDGGTTFVGTDGTTFEAERGEKMFVVNRQSSALLDALDRVNAWGRKGRGSVGRNYLADGGFVARNSANAVQSSIESETLRQSVNQLSKMTIVTKISDLERVQEDVNFNKAVATL